MVDVPPSLMPPTPPPPPGPIRRRDIRCQAMAAVHLFETRADKHMQAGEMVAGRECWDAAAAFMRIARVADGLPPETTEVDKRVVATEIEDGR